MDKYDILVVDDSKTQAEMLKQTLEMNHYNVRVAYDGKEALALLNNNYTPHIIISDIMMPEMNGYELCRHIRMLDQHKNTLLILLTTLTNTENIVEALRSGANYFITKPYEAEFLIKYLNTAMINQEARNNKLLRSATDNEIFIIFDGKEYAIKADKNQLADLLISSYDAAIQKNNQLYLAQQELFKLNNTLEKLVNERTIELQNEIEERKLYEKQFIQAQKMESIGHLTGGIAHDFNNLLMVIQGNLDLLRMDFENNKEIVGQIDDALNATHAGADLIKRLMAFSRIQKLKPELIYLDKLIPEFSQLLKPALGEGINLKINIENNIMPIFVDPSQLESAILNIAVNSRDAMNHKGTFSIEVSTLTLDVTAAIKKKYIPAGSYIKISLSDTGCGIPRENIDKVFDPFFTTKEIGKGTGLGLSMVFGFVKQSGGYITIYSEEEKGTVINIYFPQSEIKMSEQKHTLKDIPLNDLKGAETILLVEDEKSVRNLAIKFLKSLGYDVMEASNGVVALNLIKQYKHISLILTDIVMPCALTGPEMVKKAIEINPNIKVIFMSGYPKGILTDDSSMNIGSYPILNKPFSKKDLAILVRRELGPVVN